MVKWINLDKTERRDNAIAMLKKDDDTIMIIYEDSEAYTAIIQLGCKEMHITYDDSILLTMIQKLEMTRENRLKVIEECFLIRYIDYCEKLKENLERLSVTEDMLEK